MIKVDDLTFTYAGTKRPANRNLSFEIEDGEIFGFLGPSGAGKSTTQKILIGLLKSYQGDIKIFGKDLKSWDGDYYERIGVSFELPNHYLKLSGIENLTYFRALYQGRTYPPWELLEMVGLSEDGEMLVSQYSKGMKNRLSVARSLLNDPELIFMDEPTAGLDPINARRIKKLIKTQKKEGKTIFLTTHDMYIADELCDRVAFIVDGEITLVGAPRELKLQYGEHRVRVEYRNDDKQIKQKEFPLDGLGDNGKFVEVLRNHEIRTIHTLEATLEDVFIKETGRSLT